MKDEGRRMKAEAGEQRNIYVALVRLERPGGGFVEPGQLCQWETARGRALLEMGLVRRVTLNELASGTQVVLRCDQRGTAAEAEENEILRAEALRMIDGSGGSDGS